MRVIKTAGIALLTVLGAVNVPVIGQTKETFGQIDLPDVEVASAYDRAAQQNVLAAVNHKIFFGYWSVCADGKGFGHGNTYPSLDGHQMTDALLLLGQAKTVKANWDYVRSFQKPDGQLPLAILPELAGKIVGPPVYNIRVDANGGLYTHWVPGNPLRALAGPTYIQNADVIFRRTQDLDWLVGQLPSINLAADDLASLTTDVGAVRGAGYYLERPTRVDYDGVAQCHAADAFLRAAALNRVAGKTQAAERYKTLADQVATHFRRRFWVEDKGHFAEYIHPQRGVIASHGLTDVDWSAIATGLASTEQKKILWPQLKDEKRFYYGGMPTGIATLPETYEAWEFTHPDRHDLAAMGRVWYLECWARARMEDGEGLLNSIRKVCNVGKENGYYWQERYNAQGGRGPNTYCEYPANLLRIIQRFVFGVEHGLDGSIRLAPTAPQEYWNIGFGQTISWRGRRLSYRMDRDGIQGAYHGGAPQRLSLSLPGRPDDRSIQAKMHGRSAKFAMDGTLIVITLPAAPAEAPCRFEVRVVP